MWAITEKRPLFLAENHRARKAKEALQQKDVSQLGDLLYASHQGFSEDYEVSCEDLV